MASRVTHGLGRRFSPDDRDRNYLMRRRLAAPGTVLPSRKTWRIAATALDQGNTGTCVGHAWTNWMRCAPIRTTKNADKTRWELYRLAVADDEWSGNDNEASLPDGDPGLDDGTSIRAGAEAVVKTGRMKSYVWAFSLTPAVEWVLTEGPVVLGTDWPDWTPDAEGIVRITATTKFVGGHAYLWRGVDTRRDLALCSNSWGDDWGKSGDFYIPLRDLERLIHQQGEVCSAIEQKLKPKATMPPPQTAAA